MSFTASPAVLGMWTKTCGRGAAGGGGFEVLETLRVAALPETALRQGRVRPQREQAGVVREGASAGGRPAGGEQRLEQDDGLVEPSGPHRDRAGEPGQLGVARKGPPGLGQQRRDVLPLV